MCPGRMSCLLSQGQITVPFFPCKLKRGILPAHQFPFLFHTYLETFQSTWQEPNFPFGKGYHGIPHLSHRAHSQGYLLKGPYSNNGFKPTSGLLPAIVNGRRALNVCSKCMAEATHTFHLLMMNYSQNQLFPNPYNTLMPRALVYLRLDGHCN